MPPPHAAKRDRLMRLSLSILCFSLGACATMSDPVDPGASAVFAERGRQEDLLAAGLGIAGLADAKGPDPGSDAAGRRRLAIHQNWRGIADLSAEGGFGTVYGGLKPVPGTEVKAWIGESGMLHPHGVLLQIPDSFDADRPCLVVAPVSGSRGIFGAMASAAAWGLQRGCAVVSTDKGAGTGFFDLDAGAGLSIDGAPVPASPASGFNVDPSGSAPADGVRGVALKHAHSQDHPEANWGRMTLSALRFALLALEQHFPGRRFDAGNTRVIAASLSNGAGAVLHALERDDEGLIDAVVVAAPQISVAGTPVLLDYASQAALLAPCAQLAPGMEAAPFAALLAMRRGQYEARCRRLRELDWVDGDDLPAQTDSAVRRLLDLGFPESALDASPTNLVFDLWRALLPTYASSYARLPAHESFCGYRYAHVSPDGRPRAATAADHAAWFATSSGIAPTAGVQLIDPPGEAEDPAFAGLWCARQAIEGADGLGPRIRRGAEALRASGRFLDRPVLVIHGRDDGLIPVGATARPWVASALAQGARQLAYWEVENVQHFDAFLGQAAFAARYLPLLAYFYQGLDQIAAHLDGGPPPAPSQVVRTQRRGLTPEGKVPALEAGHLGELRRDPGRDAIRLGDAGLVVPK